jgi:hypothetical protein
VSVGGVDCAVIVWKVLLPKTSLQVVGASTRDIRTALDYAQQLASMGSAPNHLIVAIAEAEIRTSSLDAAAGGVVVVLKCGDEAYTSQNVPAGAAGGANRDGERGGSVADGRTGWALAKWGGETFDFRNAVDPFARLTLIVKVRLRHYTYTKHALHSRTAHRTLIHPLHPHTVHHTLIHPLHSHTVHHTHPYTHYTHTLYITHTHTSTTLTHCTSHTLIHPLHSRTVHRTHSYTHYTHCTSHTLIHPHSHTVHHAHSYTHYTPGRAARGRRRYRE